MAFLCCMKCSSGELVPLSDYGSQRVSASVVFKAWVCTNPACLWNVKMDRGNIIMEAPVRKGKK